MCGQVDSEGKKIGKSEAGAVWLAPDKLSPYKFYQYLFATTDADVVRFLKMLTFLPLEEITAMEAAMAAPGYAPNTAQKLLAQEVTRFVHGEEGLEVRCRGLLWAHAYQCHVEDLTPPANEVWGPWRVTGAFGEMQRPRACV